MPTTTEWNTLGEAYQGIERFLAGGPQQLSAICREGVAHGLSRIRAIELVHALRRAGRIRAVVVGGEPTELMEGTELRDRLYVPTGEPDRPLFPVRKPKLKAPVGSLRFWAGTDLEGCACIFVSRLSPDGNLDLIVSFRWACVIQRR